MKPNERNELANTVHGNANICLSVYGVVYNFALERWWTDAEKDERDYQFSYLSKLVINTRTDDESVVLRRAQLAAERTFCVVVPLTLRHVASAMKHYPYTVCSDSLIKYAGEIDELSSSSTGRVNTDRILDIAFRVANGINVPYDLFPHVGGGSITRAVVDAREAIWTLVEAVRTVAAPIVTAGNVDVRAMSAGVSVGTASVTAVRAILNAGVAEAQAVDIGAGNGIRLAADVRRSVKSSKNLVRDELINLVQAMCVMASEPFPKPCSAKRNELCYGNGT